MTVDVNEIGGFITSTENTSYLLDLAAAVDSRLEALGVSDAARGRTVGPITSFTDPANLDYARLFPGQVFFVDSANTDAEDDTSHGGIPSYPLATIDYAVGLCTANAGDVIVVMPSHAETLATAGALTVDVAGVTIMGLGVGTNRPTLTYSATAATALMAAANTKLSNIRFVSNVDSLVVFVTGSAGNVTIEKCDFLGASTKEVLCAIHVPTTYDDWTIKGCKFRQATDPAGTNGAAGTGAIYLVDSEDVLIEDCVFYGGWETALVHNKTTAALNLWVKNCRGIVTAAAADALPFVLVAGTTGGVERCSFINANEIAVTEATLSGTFGAGFFNFDTFWGNDGGGGQLAVAGQSAAS